MAGTLREINKERTRVAIVRAALALFIQQGYDETTIPMIAAAAGVSPRTVSTYFPVKADIAIGPLDVIFKRLDRCLRARGQGESTLDAVQRWMEGEVTIGDETGENLVLRAMARNPALQVRERERMIEAEKAIARSLAHELALPKSEIFPRLVAAAALAMTFELWGHKHVSNPKIERAHISDQPQLIPEVIGLLRLMVQGAEPSMRIASASS
jgi:AcrR family transcriptional regulator